MKIRAIKKLSGNFRKRKKKKEEKTFF